MSRVRRPSVEGVPHFYFHLYDDQDLLDEEGTDLPNAAAARAHAIGEAREMACDEVHHGHLNLDHRIEIEDEQGGRTSVTFRDAIRLIG